MIRRWFVVLGVAGGFLIAPSTDATDFVQRDLHCPLSIDVQVDMVNRIGSDPTFETSSGAVAFARGDSPTIKREGQKLTCTYRLRGILSGREVVYGYTAKRRIVECKQLWQNHLQCLLEP
jgi:hypothetical protein